ncbi:MAG: type IX secretion system protein PorQ [Bacteroidaceae bacterium]|nr:type IX secretion system protein PorQ [Bacteroidaceae bacterium]
MKGTGKILACCVSALLAAQTLQAQSLESSFEFMRLPVSAHNSSLGGHVVSAYDPSPVLFITNPALLSANESRLLGLNAMTWFSGTTVAGAQFINSFDERSHYAFNARYVSYGKMKETTADGTVTGTFTSKDIAVGATWSYLLADNLSGGVTGNFITSRYGSMTSVAIGVDLGLLWYNDNGLSIGLAATNLGGQIKAFENQFQKLPFDLCAGITWQPAHAPLRFTLSCDNLTRWKKTDFYFAEGEKSGSGEILKRHISLGADINLTERFYVAMGCNLRTRAEMAGKGSKGFTGMSIGTGLRLGKVMFDLSYGKYQVSESSLICNFAFNI